MTETEVDPRTELADLSLALRAAVRRRRRGGARRVAPVRLEALAAAAPPPPAVGGKPTPLPPERPAPPGTPDPPGPPVTPDRPGDPAGPKPGPPGPGAPPTAEVARAAGSLEELRAAVAECRACALCESRTRTVFMDGEGTRPVLFVGEAPGFHEDQQGVPFVGKAGELLTDIIQKGMGLARSEVSIANVLKCRPPENRDPSPAEKALCTPFLDRQIELLDPKVIIPLGRHAANHVLGTDEPMGRLRGRVHSLGGRSVVPTFHPAYLLRTPSAKRDCWADIQLAMAELGLPKPSRETR